MLVLSKFFEIFSLRLDFRRALLRLALAPVALLFIFTLVVWLSNRALLDMNSEVVASRNIVNTSNELMLNFVNMESGLRGYIAARNHVFLQPYWEGSERVPDLLKSLRERVKGNPQHLANLEQASEQHAKWVEYAENVRRAIQQDPGTATPTAFFDGRGKQLMDGVRVHMGNIVSAEELTSTTKGAQISKLVRQATSLTLAFLLIAGFFLVLHTQREIKSLNNSFQDNLRRAEESHRELVLLNDSLEKTVASRTNELEAFCYSVSHDLRAPLRGIDGFSLALLEDYGTDLQEPAQKYLRFVRQGVQKMGKLIDDLLALSRVSRKELSFESVDLAAIADEALTELKTAEPGRKVNFVSEGKAEIVGDKGMLQSLMTNLIANAWKFTQKRDVARVEFGQLKKDGQKIYFVRDNGAGFDMAHYDKLFGAFQRLHSPNEFQGTGVGLATVRRIARRHGGDVWAEAKVGEGATFYFVIGNPAELPANLMPKEPQA